MSLWKRWVSTHSTFHVEGWCLVKQVFSTRASVHWELLWLRNVSNYVNISFLHFFDSEKIRMRYRYVLFWLLSLDSWSMCRNRHCLTCSWAFMHSGQLFVSILSILLGSRDFERRVWCCNTWWSFLIEHIWSYLVTVILHCCWSGLSNFILSKRWAF